MGSGIGPTPPINVKERWQRDRPSESAPYHVSKPGVSLSKLFPTV